MVGEDRHKEKYVYLQKKCNYSWSKNDSSMSSSLITLKDSLDDVLFILLRILLFVFSYIDKSSVGSIIFKEFSSSIFDSIFDFSIWSNWKVSSRLVYSVYSVNLTNKATQMCLLLFGLRTSASEKHKWCIVQKVAKNSSLRYDAPAIFT